MGVGRIFSRGATRGFLQIFSRGGSKVVKFVFCHSKLKNNLFLLKISKSRGIVLPCPPSDVHECCVRAVHNCKNIRLCIQRVQ